MQQRPTRSATRALAFLLAIVAALMLAACGGGGDEAVLVDPTTEPTETPTAEPTPTPEPTPEPTPMPTPVPVSPLNGTPIEGDSTTTRVLGVKIDNHVNAQPQSGIQHADMMVEIQVEGITRFLSLWQESDTDFLGPIRSMRPTDFAVLNALEATFVNSGGQAWVAAIGNASRVAFYTEPSGSFRIQSRYAPHNLYGDTVAFRQLDGRGDYAEPLPPLWNFGELGAGATEVAHITTNWDSGYQVNWDWNGSAWERSTWETPHNYLDDDNVPQRITADTIVMLETNQYRAGSGAGSVPASETVGSGAAWVFADGKVNQGTWSRASEEEWFVLSAADGSEMTVPPGYLWLVLAHTGGVSVS